MQITKHINNWRNAGKTCTVNIIAATGINMAEGRTDGMLWGICDWVYKLNKTTQKTPPKVGVFLCHEVNENEVEFYFMSFIGRYSTTGGAPDL